ncbi:MAG TPA: Wzz/FepE/Etk N-terminal domain-containing protein [Actinocatenispora sp.]
MSATRNNHVAIVGGPTRVESGPPGRRFLLAHAGWIVLVTLLVVLGAAALSWSRTPVYASTAQVQVPPRVVAGTNVAQPVDMGTEKAVATSSAVVTLAARHLHEPVAVVDRGLSVSVPVDTEILQISHTGGTPVQAQRRAQAVAQAYVSYRTVQQRNELAAVKKANGKNVTLVPAPAPALINDADVPTSPASPNHRTDLAIALVIGLVLGIGIALLADRRDDRVRGGADLAAQARAPLFGQIPAYHPAGVVGPSAAADAYRQVRARLSRALTAERARTLLVTSPSGHRTGDTAANLAAGLARTGTRVVLVGSATPFGLPAEPTLGDVLAGTTGVGDAVRHTGVDGLSLLPAGAYGDPDALLSGAALTSAMHELCWRADLVIIDVPPVDAGPDAELLAAHADLVLLVARARRTRRRQVRQAVERLGAAGTSLAGCVLDGVGWRRRVPVESWQSTAALPMVHRGQSSADEPTQEIPTTGRTGTGGRVDAGGDGHRAVLDARRTATDDPATAAQPAHGGGTGPAAGSGRATDGSRGDQGVAEPATLDGHPGVAEPSTPDGHRPGVAESSTSDGHRSGVAEPSGRHRNGPADRVDGRRPGDREIHRLGPLPTTEIRWGDDVG